MKSRYRDFCKLILTPVLVAAFSIACCGCFTGPDPFDRFEAPDPPTNLRVVVGYGDAELTWTPPVSPISHYLISVVDYERVLLYSDTTGADNFIITNLSPGVVCYTAVSSVSETGIESETSTPIQGQKMIPGYYILSAADGDTVISTPQVEFVLNSPENMEFVRISSVEAFIDSIDWVPYQDSVEFALPCSTTGYYPVYARFMDRTGFQTSVLSCSLFYDPGI